MEDERSHETREPAFQQRDRDGRPESKSDDDGTMMSSGPSKVASNHGPLWEQVRQVELELAEQKKNDRAQAESKKEFDGHLRQTRAEAAETRTELEEMKVNLAEEQEKGKQTQAQLKEYVRQARARDVRKDKDLEEAQAQLVQYQQLLADEGAELSKANVMLKGNKSGTQGRLGRS